ncbi:MAG: glycosyltransferase family 4 protein [Candidatus Liptonbacteria bacterium]|nr:glycosyltransferase family 4 protein [Candidatus Liptonbacteria bacterium]
MKIAIVSINLEAQGGGNRQILILARNLQKMGNKVAIYTVAANKGAFSKIQENLDVRVIPAPGGAMDWKAKQTGFIGRMLSRMHHYRQELEAAKTIAEAMDADFDVVNVHDFAYQAAYFYKKRNPSCRVVWTMNEPPYIHLKKDDFLSNIGSIVYNKMRDFTEKKFIRAVDAGAVLAPFQMEWLKKRGVNESRVIISGVDFDDFYAPAKRLPQDLSKEPFGKAQSGPLKLMTLGTPNKYRRYEDAIIAAKILRDKGLNVRLDVVANNVWQENEYCGMLEKLVKENNLESIVKLSFAGVSEEELRRLYKESHILLHLIHVPPIRSGSTFGLVIWEAMAAGILVIANHEPKLGSRLTDGENAVFVKPENAADLAEKIEKIASQPELYFKIAQSSQRFVKENISWDIYAREMMELFTPV